LIIKDLKTIDVGNPPPRYGGAWDTERTADGNAINPTVFSRRRTGILSLNHFLNLLRV
jgi:hypothetical protein